VSACDRLDIILVNKSHCRGWALPIGVHFKPEELGREAGRAPGFSGILRPFSLQPAPDACLVPPVFVAEACFEVALLARYDDERHHGNRWEQRDQDPGVVDRERDSSLKQREREIDGVATEAVRPGLDDGGSGSIPGHRRARCVECSDRPDEKRSGKNRYQRPERHRQAGNEWERPNKMQHQARDNRSQIDGWRTHEAEVRGKWRRVLVLRSPLSHLVCARVLHTGFPKK